MAHIWIQDEVQWKDLPIQEDTFSIPPVMLMRSGPDANAAGRELWVLIAPPETQLRVNGEATSGIRAIADRDEIRIEQRTIYFSIERRAAVTQFAGEPVICARCKLHIRPGDPAVACPACTVWHHQSEEYPCWTYAGNCSLCPFGTDLAAGYQWSPEEV